MGSLTVFVRGVSLDSCIEARAVPVGVGGRGRVDSMVSHGMTDAGNRVCCVVWLLERPSFLSLPAYLREFIRWRDPG